MVNTNENTVLIYFLYIELIQCIQRESTVLLVFLHVYIPQSKFFKAHFQFHFLYQ